MGVVFLLGVVVCGSLRWEWLSAVGVVVCGRELFSAVGVVVCGREL